MLGMLPKRKDYPYLKTIFDYGKGDLAPASQPKPLLVYNVTRKSRSMGVSLTIETS
jgi:hypothetical protein